MELFWWLNGVILVKEWHSAGIRKALNIKLRNDTMLSPINLFALKIFCVRFSTHFDIKLSIIHADILNKYLL